MRIMILSIGAIIISTFAVFAQSPQVVQTTPGFNALGVDPGEDVIVAFDMNMDETTFNDSTFLVFARSSGLHAGTFSYDSTTFEVTFESNNNYAVGEIVSVTLTTGIKSATGTPLDGSFIWNFIIMSGGGAGQFNIDQTYNVGTDPLWINAADFDNDGDLDIAVANNQSHHISIYFNQGDGSFAQRQDYPAGTGTCCLIVSDFENDGDIDVAASNWQSHEISVFLNNGSGTFAAAANYPVGNAPYTVHSADFNGDGYMDLTSSNHNENNISVLMNNGDGTFGSHTTYYSGLRVFCVYTADFDNDGDIDICSCNHDDQNVSVFSNDGNGVFSSPAHYPTGGISVGVTAADMNGDGYADIATADFGQSTVSVMLNNGNGTFGFYSTFAVDGSPRTISSADFDGDGDIDLMASNYQSGNVTLLTNNGSGSFSHFAQLPQGNRYTFAADYDGDSDLDLAVSNAYGAEFIIMLNEYGLITGTVTDSNSVPLEDVFVFTADTLGHDLTDANGQYELSLAEGYYDITFQKSGYYEYFANDVYVGLGDTITLDVILLEIAPPCSSCVMGLVTNIIFAQLESVYVSAVGTSVYDYTDIAGSYSLPGLDPGTYNISFSHPSYADTTVNNVVVEFDQYTQLDMMVRSNSAISGVVADIVSQPVAGAYVSILVQDLTAITDSSGEYLVSGVVPGISCDVHYTHYNYSEYVLHDVIVAANETLALDTVYLAPVSSEVMVWYGNLNLSPVTAPIGETILIDVYARSEPYIGFMHLPLATNDQYIVDHHSVSEGVFYYPLTDWDDARFLNPDYLSIGWHSQSLLGFYDITGGPNPPFQSLDPVKIASFAFEIADDTSLIGATVQCLAEGHNPANGDPLFGDINGVDPYFPYQLFSPLHFVEPPTGGCQYVVGDINDDGFFNGIDVIYSVNYFKGGPAPFYECECTPGNTWFVAGDVNGSCFYNGIDVTYGVAYFKGGPEPFPCPDCSPTN